MRACASGPPPRGDGRPPLPAHPEGLAATLRVLQSTLYSGRNSAVMAGPMAELDLQREVEALRARRRLSVNRLALVDPDLPGLDAAVPVPGTPPSPSAEAGGVPPSNPSSVPIFGSSRRDRSQTRRQIPVPALPDSNIWVPASAHPEVSPGDFRAFMREQAERNVQHAEAAPEVLLTRSPSLTRRASLLRQQVHPDEAPPARRGSLLAMDEPAAPEKPAADREHAANGEAGHALHRSPAQRSSRAPRRRPVTEELGEVQDCWRLTAQTLRGSLTAQKAMLLPPAMQAQPSHRRPRHRRRARCPHRPWQRIRRARALRRPIQSLLRGLQNLPRRCERHSRPRASSRGSRHTRRRGSSACLCPVRHAPRIQTLRRMLGATASARARRARCPSPARILAMRG